MSRPPLFRYLMLVAISAIGVPTALPSDKIVIPVKPKDVVHVEGEIVRDDNAPPYTLVKTKAEKLDCRNDIQHIACHPSGREIYMSFTGKSKIYVLDPATMKPKSRIETPSPPTTIWSNEKWVLATCPKAKAVVVIDSSNHKLERTFKLDDTSDLVPALAVGMTSDGSLLARWESKPNATFRYFLTHSMKDGTSKLAVMGHMRRYFELPSGKLLLTQGEFPNESAQPRLAEVTNERRLASSVSWNRLVKTRFPMIGSFAHCFLTRACKHVVVPTTWFGGDPWTQVISREFLRPAFDIPGKAIVEVPHSNILVTCGLFEKSKPTQHVRVYYASAATGRVIRRVEATGIPAGDVESCFFYRDAPHIVYVPGHEMLFLGTYQRRTGKKRILWRIRCGPVKAQVLVPSDPRLAATNPPPRRARVGETLTYDPKVPANARIKPKYTIKEKLEGMVVKPDTGELSWTPTAAFRGRYEIDIQSQVDGKTISVVQWILTIE